MITVKQKAMEKLKPQTKVRLVLNARMEKVNLTDDSSIVELQNFPSKAEKLVIVTNLDELWIKMVEQILENISVFQMNGSVWTFHSIVSLNIHAVNYTPFRGAYVSLPKYLARKKALKNMTFINMNRRNEDVQCFKLCIARALNPVKVHPERNIGKLEEQAETSIFENISFRVKLIDISKFE